MNQVILWIMAAGVVLGGIDRIFGSPKGYGKKFEEGFFFLGPTALSMAGMICLAPVLAKTLGRLIIPAFGLLGVDPAMFGGLLAIDMGGYQLACSLAQNPLMGQYAGIVIAAVFGCTVVFTIPVGMGIVEKEDKPLFAQGIMIGLMVMPVSLVAGGLVCGLSLLEIVHQNLPVLVFSLLLLLGLKKAPAAMIKGFTIFASGIQILITIGLVIAAVTSLTGLVIIPGMAPLEDALAVVASIGIVMLGSLPMAELLTRLLKQPLLLLGKKCGMNSISVAGFLVGIVSAIPAITMLKHMDKRGKVVNVAFLVSAASMLAAHLGFTVSEAPGMLPALLAAKLSGAFAAIPAALLFTKGTGAKASAGKTLENSSTAGETA